MLSYRTDADIHTNLFELGLDRLVDLYMVSDFIGKAVLKKVRTQGVSRMQAGLVIKGESLPGPNTTF